MKIQIGLAFAILVAFSGCEIFTGLDVPRTEFKTDQASYRLGEEVVLTLTNLMGNEIEIGVNPSTPPSLSKLLQRRVDGEWKTQASIISLVGGYRELNHGDVFTNPPIAVTEESFPPGFEYRFVIGIRNLSTGKGMIKHSDSFTVVE